MSDGDIRRTIRRRAVEGGLALGAALALEGDFHRRKSRSTAANAARSFRRIGAA